MKKELLRMRQFRSQMYFYYTNRGTHIYIWPRAAIPPATPLGVGVGGVVGGGGGGGGGG